MTFNEYLFYGWVLVTLVWLSLNVLILVIGIANKDVACCLYCHVFDWRKRRKQRRQANAAFPKARIVKQ